MFNEKFYKLLNDGVKNSGLELKPEPIASDKGYKIGIFKNNKEVDHFHIPAEKAMMLVSLMKG